MFVGQFCANHPKMVGIPVVLAGGYQIVSMVKHLWKGTIVEGFAYKELSERRQINGTKNHGKHEVNGQKFTAVFHSENEELRGTGIQIKLPKWKKGTFQAYLIPGKVHVPSPIKLIQESVSWLRHNWNKDVDENSLANESQIWSSLADLPWTIGAPCIVTYLGKIVLKGENITQLGGKSRYIVGVSMGAYSLWKIYKLAWHLYDGTQVEGRPIVTVQNGKETPVRWYQLESVDKTVRASNSMLRTGCVHIHSPITRLRGARTALRRGAEGYQTNGQRIWAKVVVVGSIVDTIWQVSAPLVLGGLSLYVLTARK